MMPNLIQMFCLFVIAVGSGLLAFSNKLDPPINFFDPTTLTRSSMTHVTSDDHLIASISSGFGSGLLILGLLGLVLPWVNKLGAAMTNDLSDNSARTIATVTIWLSIAMILTFGVFRMNWTGAAGLSAVLIIVAITCSAATIVSAMVCGWRPWIRSHYEMPLSVRQTPDDVSAGNL